MQRPGWWVVGGWVAGWVGGREETEAAADAEAAAAGALPHKTASGCARPLWPARRMTCIARHDADCVADGTSMTTHQILLQIKRFSGKQKQQQKQKQKQKQKKKEKAEAPSEAGGRSKNRSSSCGRQQAEAEAEAEAEAIASDRTASECQAASECQTAPHPNVRPHRIRIAVTAAPRSHACCSRHSG